MEGVSLHTHSPYPGLGLGSSPEILLFIECYRWLRGQETLPLLNSALGTTEAWKESSPFLPSCFSKPPLRSKKQEKQRERENILKYFKAHP